MSCSGRCMCTSLLLHLLLIATFIEIASLETSEEEDVPIRMLGEFIYYLINRDFSDSSCIGIVTEQSPSILNYIPKKTLRYHFQIGGKNSPIPDVEDSVTFDYTTLNNSTRKLESFLIESLNAGCPLYVIQVSNPKAIIRCFTRSSRRAMFRLSRFYVFLPMIEDGEAIMIKEDVIFAMKDMDFLPDLVVCRIVQNGTKMNKNSTYLRGFEYFTWKAEVIINHFNLLHRNNCIGEKTLATTDKNVRTGEDILEVRTHKFVGINKSENVLLDIWIPGKETCSGRFLYSAKIFPDKIRNVEGRKIVLIPMYYPPFIIFNLKKKPILFDGIELRIINEFIKYINGSIRITSDPLHYWGDAYENGTSDGVIGYVAMDKADIGACAYYSWPKGYQICDFSTTHMRSSVTMITPRPKLKPAWMVPLMPFDGVMWGAVSACLLSCMYVLYALQNFVDRILGRPEDRLSPYANIDYSVLRTYAMLLNQGPTFRWDTCSRHVPARHFVGWFQFMGEVISDTYNAGLASVLSSPRYEPPIETIHDLAVRNVLWGANHISWIWSVQESEQPDLQIITNNFRLHSEEEMIKLGRKDGEMAFGLERMQGGHFTTEPHVNEATVQKRRIMKDELYWSHLYILLRKGSPYIRHFNAMVRRIRESGLPLYWEGEVIRQHLSDRLQLQISTSRILHDDTGPLKLNLNELQGAFLMLVLGHSAGLVFFLIELSVGGRKRKISKVRKVLAPKQKSVLKTSQKAIQVTK